jgi:hypothetical protein
MRYMELADIWSSIIVMHGRTVRCCSGRHAQCRHRRRLRRSEQGSLVGRAVTMSRSGLARKKASPIAKA